MSDATKKIVWRWDGDAFGQTPPNQNPDGDAMTDVLNLRFPGQIADSETGLYYNINRYYDPGIGRYITSDPIGLQGGLNSYAYVDGNPISNIDPLGLWSIGFELYGGWGGGFSFGKDPSTGQSFFTSRIGYGIGGGFDWDPLGGWPGAGATGCNGGVGGGVYGKVGGRIGPLKAGLGAGGGAQTGAPGSSSAFYGYFAKPKASFTNRGAGINASAAAGFEGTIFNKGECGCSGP